jgi:hypothetical protein
MVPITELPAMANSAPVSHPHLQNIRFGILSHSRSAIGMGGIPHCGSGLIAPFPVT